MLQDREIFALTQISGGWHVRTNREEMEVPVLVNAAGAWCDDTARMAGVAPVGLVPKRRAVALIDVSEGLSATHWPAAVHVAESFYFKPDAGRLLLSPADETPSPPADAQPEDLDLAVAVDRFEEATDRTVGRLRSSWAGLRTFVGDKTPVVGFDASATGFFWFVGQGGYGIQTASGMARAGSLLARCLPIDEGLMAEGVSADALSPARSGLR